jgi:peptidoglycan/LPS O-acetylase OafA/YrhL
LFALAHVFGNRLSVGVQFCLFVPLSIGLSYLFCVGIEERFLQLSRMVGKRWAVLPDGRAARAASVQTPF